MNNVHHGSFFIIKINNMKAKTFSNTLKKIYLDAVQFDFFVTGKL